MGTTVEIACCDGVHLAGGHFPAVGGTQGSIVVACAFGIRHTFYQRFTVLAAASDYEVLLFNYRGSEGNDSAVASYRLTDQGHEDIDTTLVWCRARALELPHYFAGHNIDVQLLDLAGQANGLSGAAFVAGSFPYWRRWQGKQRQQMFSLFCVAVPLLTELPRRFPGCFFSLGSLDMPSHSMRDWARWVRQPDYLLAPRLGLQRQGYRALDIPVANFLLEDDGYMPWAAAEKLHQVYTAAHLELRRKRRAKETVEHFGLFHNEALRKELLDYFRKLPDTA